MFNATFTPLYAEQYMGEENIHQQYRKGQDDDQRNDRRSRAVDEDFEFQLPKLARVPVMQPEKDLQQALYDVSPTSTETGSEYLCPEKLEEGFSNDIFVRKLSWSGSPKQPALSQSFSGRSANDSIPEDQLKTQDVYKEIHREDRRLQKLTKQLEKMQRRIIDLEVDRRCRDLRFERKGEGFLCSQSVGSRHVAREILHQSGGGSETSNPSDEESQLASVGAKHQANRTSANKRSSKALDRYEDMELNYAEHSVQDERLKDKSVSNESGHYGARLDNSDISSSQEGLHSAGPPDPPELATTEPQRQYVRESFHPLEHSHKKEFLEGDEDGREDDDLSSRAVDELIDEDIRSDCQAVKDHNGDGRQYWRDIILGVNDGLVSTFLLVAGVRGGGMNSTEILLTAIAGAVAGAVSMCAGEYVATKSQNEVMQGEIATEERHIREYRRDELIEVSHLLTLIGIDDNNRALQRRLIRHYARDPAALLKIMVALELGCLEDEERSPFMAGFVSFFLFLIGAAPSVIPFMVTDIDPTVGFIIAGVATCIFLLFVGAVKTWATKGNWLTAAMENLFVAGFGGAVAYGAGVLSQKFIE